MPMVLKRCRKDIPDENLFRVVATCEPYAKATHSQRSCAKLTRQANEKAKPIKSGSRRSLRFI